MSNVEIEFTDRGVLQGVDFFSTRAVEVMEDRSAAVGFPAHIQAQIRERRKIIRDIIHHQMERAVNSDRFLTEIKLRSMGHTEAADFLKVERITK